MLLSRQGVFFALAAAAMNGSIGVLSKMLILSGLTSSWIAFIKTLFGFICVSIILFFFRFSSRFSTYINLRPLTVKRIIYVGVASFFGMFLLFFFETAAYRAGGAASVVIVLMATACVTAVLGTWLFFSIKPRAKQWIGLGIAMIGISCMTGIDYSMRWSSMGLAAIAGFGYGAFTVLIKVFRLEGGMILTRQLLGMASLWLVLPLLGDKGGFSLQLFSQPLVWVCLFALAIFPSILGFYCTTRAVDLLTPATVQLIELSEPLFAAVFALLFLNEAITQGLLFGGLMTLAGIYIAVRPSN